MDKMMMNKLDDKEMELDEMELEMVAGGNDWKKNVEKGRKVDEGLKKNTRRVVNAIKNGVNTVKDFFDLFKPKWVQPGKPQNNILD